MFGQKYDFLLCACSLRLLVPLHLPHQPAETPAAAPEPADPAEPSVSAEADMACGDLLSLRSDTLSLAGDRGHSRTVSRNLHYLVPSLMWLRREPGTERRLCM